MARREFGKDRAAKEKRYDCDADACHGCEEPDEANEGCNTHTEEWWYVDLHEEIHLATLRVLFLVTDTVIPLIVFVDFDEGSCALWHPHLVGAWCANVFAISQENGLNATVLCKHLSVFTDDWLLYVASLSMKHVGPCPPNVSAFLVRSGVVEQEAGESQCACTFAKPPAIDLVESD